MRKCANSWAIVLTDDQYAAGAAMQMIRMALAGRLKIYENVPEIVQHWIDRGVATLQQFKQTSDYSDEEFETRVVIDPAHRNYFEMTQKLLINLYNLENY